jgi:hypothetical protein
MGNIFELGNKYICIEKKIIHFISEEEMYYLIERMSIYIINSKKVI